MRRVVSLPNFGCTPDEFVDLAIDLEASGWGGLLVYDHLQFFASMELEIFDPWVLLAAAAQATDRLRLGTGVTPISRRRPWKLAKEVVTLDHLSDGRAVLGVGLGGPDEDEFEAFGDTSSLKERAMRTDEALDLLDRFLRGEAVDHQGEHYQVDAHLRPGAVQSPRPPIWTAATPPHRLPLERAAHWDGVYCNVKIESDFMPLTPDELKEYLGDFLDRSDLDVVTPRHPDHDADEYEEVGVSWLAEGTGVEPGWIEQVRQRLL